MNTDAPDADDDVDHWKTERSITACLAGPMAALALTGGLVSQRDRLGVANVGFLALLVVLGAALAGGRLAGVITAVIGALAFNYFHTQPYLTLEVAVREDVISVALCAIVGLAIGDVGGRLYERTQQLRRARHELEEARAQLAGREPLA